MAIKEFLRFDQLPAGSYQANNPTNLLSFLRPDWLYDAPSGLGLLDNTSKPGWLTQSNQMFYNGSNFVSAYTGVGLPYNNVSDPSTPRTWIGFRCCVNTPLNRLTQMFCLKNAAGTYTQFLPVSLLAKNQSQYVEIMFDRTNLLYVVWIDGLQVATGFFDFNTFMAGAGSFFFGQNVAMSTGASNTADGFWAIRDVYVVDDTQDSTVCNRLGPVDVIAAPLTSVNAPNWTSSDNQTPLFDLTTILGTTTATQTLPTVNEPTTMDPVQVGFGGTAVIPGESIMAFKADVTAQRVGGYLFAPLTSVKYNGQTVAGKQLTYAAGNTMVYNQRAFLLEKAPDGSAWSASAIAGTTLTLTP